MVLSSAKLGFEREGHRQLKPTLRLAGMIPVRTELAQLAAKVDWGFIDGVNRRGV
jgi:hypothetical protein